MRSLLSIPLVLVYAQSSLAQLPTPDVARLRPAAAKAGETLNVALYGSNLDELKALRFTHPRITAQRVTKPPADFFTEPQPQGSSFLVTVANHVPPGIYEARAVSYLGISTARAFLVAPADSNEVLETGDHSTRETAMAVEVNSVVNGEVPGRGIDWFRFQAKAGQRVLLELHAERIDSRLDGQLIVYDTKGREVARNRDTFGRDSFLEVSSQGDAEYFVAVSDILYRGGPEYFYRLGISTKPYIDFIDPPVGAAGSTETYTLFGRNLPGGKLSDISLDGHRLESLQVQITLPDVASAPKSFHPGQPRQGLLRGVDYRIANSNTVRIGFATAPVVPEATGDTVQKVDVPSEIAGRFDEANDEDRFRFTAQNGKFYCIEAIADRLGSPVDAYLIVEKITVDENGTEILSQVADNDDMRSFFRVDGKDSINPDTNDPAIVFTADYDGDYQITIVNQFGSGSPADQYRLAIREPVHDFDLLATFERPLPTGRTGYSVTPTLRRGATAGLRIIVPRQDGFEGDIVVTAEALPPGVTATPLKLSGKTDRGILVLKAALNAKSWAGGIRIIGRAKIGGEELVREARFASLVWGHIFADSIRVRSRLTQQVPLGVVGDENAAVILEPAEEKEWTVEVGKKLDIPVKVTDDGTRVGTLTVEPFGLFGLHRGAPTVNIAQDADEGTLSINFTKNGNFNLTPGRYQFVLHGTGVTKYRKNAAAITRAEAEVARITKLTEQFKSQAEAAARTAATTKTALIKARQASAKLPNDADLKATVKTLEMTVAEAEKKSQDAATNVKRVEAAKSTVDKSLAAAKSTATHKSTSFAVWSDQITVNVVPPKK